MLARYYYAKRRRSALAAAAAPPAATYADIVAAMSPDAFWPLQDASGNFVDISGNGYDAAVTGSPTYENTGPTINGEATSAVGFSGTAQYGVASEAIDDGVTTSTGMTISLWFKTSDTLANPVAKKAAGQYAFDIYLDSSPNIELNTYQTDGASLSASAETSGTYGDDAWHHCVAWVDATTNYIHITLDDTETINNTSPAGTWNAESDSAFGIGAISNGNGAYAGDLAFVAYWQRALTSGERATLYSGVE